MKPITSALAVSLATLVLTSGCNLVKVSQTEAKTYPFVGNSCIIDSDPIGDVQDLPAATFGWNFGGDEGVGGSDTRTISLKPLEDGLELIDNDGKKVMLIKNKAYLIRVKDFTEMPTGGAYPAARAGKVMWVGGEESVNLELTTGTDWPLEDFLYTVGPGNTTPGNTTARSSLTGYMFDVTAGATGAANDGFCVTFQIEGDLMAGTGANTGTGKVTVTGYDVQIRLNPDNTAPATPQLTFAYDFEDLDASTGFGELQIAVVQDVTIGTTPYVAGDQGVMQVSGMLPLNTPMGSVTIPITNAPDPLPIGTASTSSLPAPPFGIIIEGSLSGARVATVRFALVGGNTYSVVVTQ